MDKIQEGSAEPAVVVDDGENGFTVRGKITSKLRDLPDDGEDAQRSQSSQLAQSQSLTELFMHMDDLVAMLPHMPSSTARVAGLMADTWVKIRKEMRR
jgi:hypothetical protein